MQTSNGKGTGFLVFALAALLFVLASELWWYRNTIVCSDGPLASEKCWELWTHPSILAFRAISRIEPHEHFHHRVKVRPWFVDYVECREEGGAYDLCAPQARVLAAERTIRNFLDEEPTLDESTRSTLQESVDRLEVLKKQRLGSQQRLSGGVQTP